TKPFSVEELLARIRVALRHSAGPTVAAPIFTAGDLEVDLSKRVVTRRGQMMKLTHTEYDLLAYLISNSGKVLTHGEILHNVWGPEYGDEREYVRVFIGQLRRKIEDDPSNPRFIVTESRMGYRFVTPE
ncbi:MAG: response regulator transcription factor, partial [Dehalococcoidia bacterium]|nr:response regulator transcription factor [Dehalococcoidia bacterium]